MGGGKGGPQPAVAQTVLAEKPVVDDKYKKKKKTNKSTRKTSDSILQEEAQINRTILGG